MSKTARSKTSEQGQTAVLFALMIVGLIAFVGLAVDGGNVFNERRITQNAADSAALTGVHYMASSNAPNETRLQEVINGVVEANGIPDTDSTPGNAVNANITIYYTDADGVRLTELLQPCDTVPCGDIPSPARGVRVDVNNEADTFFLGVIDLQTLGVSANATAVTRGDSGGGAEDYGMIAFGSCPAGEKPLDFSANNVDVIGGVHGSSYFENRGNGNHYHGQVTYGIGYIDTAPPPPNEAAAIYEPSPPAQATPLGDPFADLFTVADFDCVNGSIGSDPSLTCYDVTSLADENDEITTRALRQNSPDGGSNYLTEPPGSNPLLRPGIYYAGDKHFNFGSQRMEGTVTLVTSGRIKLTENDLQLTGYMPSGSVLPGLLLYSGYQSPDPCANFQTDPQLVPINTTGNAGQEPPGVWHADDKPQCVQVGNADCYRLGSLKYVGVIYAPGGRVATSGSSASYLGAIVAYSIRINGSAGRSEGGGPPNDPHPDRVGALIVLDSNLFPSTEQQIFLDE